MPHSLPAIIAHVRAQSRPASYGGILLAEIDRLTEENAELRVDLANAAAWLRDTFPDRVPTKGTSDPVNAALLDALACGQGWVRDGEHVPLDDVLNPTKETTDV